MKKFVQNKLKDQKGMTLIELLAVIVIIAIIAAIAIPAIGNIIDNSRVGAIKSDANNALSAASLYQTDFPEAASVTQAELEDGGYLEEVGSFGDATAVEFVINLEDMLVTSGTGVVGAVSVAFAGADRTAINGTPNNSEGAVLTAVHGGVGTLTITR